MATKFLEPGSDATQDISFFPFTAIGASSTVASDSSQSANGPRSIKADVTVSGQSAAIAAPNGVVSDSGALISAWVRFSTVAPATRTYFIGAQLANNGSGVIYVGIDTTGKLLLYGRGTTVISGATVISANTWYRVSVGYVITSTTNWSAVLYLNGVQEATASNTTGTLSLTGTTCASFGISSSSQGGFNTPPVMSIWIDNIYVDDRTSNADCGDIRVTAKRPNANGTTNNFNTQIGVGGSGYGTGHSPQVNEQPLSVTNGWSVAAVAATTEEYNIESASTGDVNLTGATLVDYMGWVYTKALIAETAQIIVNNVTTNISVTTSNAMFTQASGSTTYPAATGTDIGMITSSTATTVSLYECGVVFAYTAAVAVASGSTLMTMGIG